MSIQGGNGGKLPPPAAGLTPRIILFNSSVSNQDSTPHTDLCTGTDLSIVLVIESKNLKPNS